MRKLSISLALIGGIVIGVLLTRIMLSSDAQAAEVVHPQVLASDATAELPESQALSASDKPLANPLIDFDGHLHQVQRVKALREQRRVSEEQFIEMSMQPGTLVLDARSADKYELLHVEGALNLPYTDFTAESLAEVIPNKETRVLIYCNNNFQNSPVAFASKNLLVSLNINTYVALASYGYTNIYELKPLLDRNTTKIKFAGTEIDTQKPTASPTARTETP